MGFREEEGDWTTLLRAGYQISSLNTIKHPILAEISFFQKNDPKICGTRNLRLDILQKTQIALLCWRHSFCAILPWIGVIGVPSMGSIPLSPCREGRRPWSSNTSKRILEAEEWRTASMLSVAKPIGMTTIRGALPHCTIELLNKWLCHEKRRWMWSSISASGARNGLCV